MTRRRRRRTSTSSTRTSRCRTRRRGRPAGSALSTQHGGRSPLRRHPRAGDQWFDYNYNEINIIENGFLNEFRLAQQNLQANIAAGRGDTFRLLRRRHRHGAAADLPGLLQRPAGLAGGQRRRLHVGAVHQHHVRQPAGELQPAAVRCRPTRSTRTPARQQQRAARRSAGELPRRQSGSARRRRGHGQRRLQPRTTRCSSQLRSACRTACSSSTNYIVRQGATSQSFYSLRTAVRDHGKTPAARVASRTPSRATGSTSCRSAADRRFGGNAGGFLDRLIGGWSFDGIARIQSGRLLDFGNVRLVGMTKDEFQKIVQAALRRCRRRRSTCCRRTSSTTPSRRSA